MTYFKFAIGVLRRIVLTWLAIVGFVWGGACFIMWEIVPVDWMFFRITGVMVSLMWGFATLAALGRE